MRLLPGEFHEDFNAETHEDLSMEGVNREIKESEFESK
jgi:hypothetical protein